MKKFSFAGADLKTWIIAFIVVVAFFVANYALG